MSAWPGGWEINLDMSAYYLHRAGCFYLQMLYFCFKTKLWTSTNTAETDIQDKAFQFAYYMKFRLKTSIWLTERLPQISLAVYM